MDELFKTGRRQGAGALIVSQDEKTDEVRWALLNTTRLLEDLAAELQQTRPGRDLAAVQWRVRRNREILAGWKSENGETL